MLGASTCLTLQASEKDDTAMLPWSPSFVTPLDHLADSVSVTADVGLLVMVSVKERVCAAVSVVPTGTTDGRLEAVIVSEICSLLTTCQATDQPPPVLQVTVPETVLWWALAAPAMPTT